MRHKTLVITTTIAGLIGGAVIYLLLTPGSPRMQPSSGTTETSAPLSIPPNKDTPATPGKYVNYNSNIIAQTPGTKLLFFHASWCPQCRALEADIIKSDIPANVTIIKVDYDSHQALRQKYGVTLQTTVVKVDDDGNLINKFVTYSEPTLDAVIKGLL